MAADNLQVKLGQDQDSIPIQVLAPDSTVARIVDPSSSDRVALPTGSQIVEISVSGAVHTAFGTVAITASTSSFYFPAGFVGVYRVPAGATHLAAIYATGTTGATVFIRRLI